MDRRDASSTVMPGFFVQNFPAWLGLAKSGTGQAGQVDPPFMECWAGWQRHLLCMLSHPSRDPALFLMFLPTEFLSADCHGTCIMRLFFFFYLVRVAHSRRQGRARAGFGTARFPWHHAGLVPEGATHAGGSHPGAAVGLSSDFLGDYAVLVMLAVPDGVGRGWVVLVGMVPLSMSIHV